MKNDPYLLQSVNNTLSLLDIFSHYRHLTLAQLTRLTPFDKASLFRMLHTLEKNGLLTRSGEGYSLGLKLLHYGGLVAARQDVVAQAKPFMQDFCQRTGLSTHLGRLSQGRVVTVHIEDPPYDIQVTARVGMSAPAYATAMGRVLLAHLPAEELEKQCAGFVYKRYSPTSLQDRAQLDELLAQVLQQGWACDMNDRFPGFAGLAVPVFNCSGRCVAAVGLVTLAQNVEMNREQYLAELRQLGPDISRALGWSGPGQKRQ